MMLSVCPCLSQRLVSVLLPARELAWSSSTFSPWRATSLPFTLAYHAWQHHLTYLTGTSMVMPLLASIIIYQERIQGGSWGADDPPFSLKMMASFRKIEPFSLANFNFFKHFQVIAASSIVNSPQKFQIWSKWSILLSKVANSLAIVAIRGRG